MGAVEEFLAHISDKPWSDYKESDYSVQQWHNACLVHDHTGPPSSKEQCKLPIKTPNGAVNSNGVQAAAAALAGARGGVKNLSSDQRSSAITALKGYYKDMGKELPPSLQHSDEELGKAFLEHYGVKGMRWGFRNTSNRRISSDHKTAHRLRRKHVSELSNDELKKLNERLNLESNYHRLNPSKVKKGHNAAKAILGSSLTIPAIVSLAKTPAGKKVIGVGKTAAKKIVGQSIKKGIQSIGKY